MNNVDKQNVAEELLFESIREIKAGYIPKAVLDHGINQIDVLSEDGQRSCVLLFHPVDESPFRVEYNVSVEALSVGDTVRHNAIGPNMMIVEIVEKDGYTGAVTELFDGTETHRGFFDVRTLTKVPDAIKVIDPEDEYITCRI